MKELNLYDVEQQKHFTFSVTDENFQEITENENLHLATTLLQKHLKEKEEKENFVAAFSLVKKSIPSASSLPKSNFASCFSIASPSDSQSLPSNTCEIVNTEAEDCEISSETSENAKLWTDDSIRYLINLCQKYDKDFSSGVKKYIWSKISKELSEKFGQLYSAQQCDTKWKGLKNTYKTVKKHNDQSGNNYKFWKFYDLMNQILFSKPEIHATATCSSSKGLILRCPNNEKMDNQLNEDPNDITTTPKNFTSSFTRKRKSTENSVERRHQEKLARQDKFLDLLGRLTAAVESSIPQPQNGNISN